MSEVTSGFLKMKRGTPPTPSPTWSLRSLLCVAPHFEICCYAYAGIFGIRPELLVRLSIFCSKTNSMSHQIAYMCFETFLINYLQKQYQTQSVKLVGYLILDIGYSILENFLSPAPHERSLSVMRYGLTNDTVF